MRFKSASFSTEHQEFPVFTVFLIIKTSSRRLLEETAALNDFGTTGSQCREIWLQVKWVTGLFRCYDNSDVIATLIIANFHHYLEQLWC